MRYVLWEYGGDMIQFDCALGVTQNDARRVCWQGWHRGFGWGLVVVCEWWFIDLYECKLELCLLKIAILSGLIWPVAAQKGALSADSIDAIHNCHWIVSAFPRSCKFLSRRWWWHGRSSNGVVSISFDYKRKSPCAALALSHWFCAGHLHSKRSIACGSNWAAPLGIVLPISQGTFVVSIEQTMGMCIQGVVLKRSLLQNSPFSADPKIGTFEGNLSLVGRSSPL